MQIEKSFFFLLVITILIAASCQKDHPVMREETNTFSLDFSLIYPPEGAEGIIPGFEFQWGKSEHAVSYTLHVGKNIGANDIIIPDITGTTWVVDTLRYEVSYFWKIVAFNSEGKTVSSPPSGFFTKRNDFVMDPSFYMPQLDRTKKIYMYLPPDYDSSTRSYPTLYMHDGGSLFLNLEIPVGCRMGSCRWELDKILDKLYQESGFSIIVVALDNNFRYRIDELTPWVMTVNGQGGEGDKYLEFIVQTLNPYIDNNYRTLADKDHTGILGASAGGWFSFYAGLKYPDIFGRVGAFSPSIYITEGRLFTLAGELGHLLNNNKIYFLAGELERDDTFDDPADIKKLTNILVQVGFNNSKTFIVPDGTHTLLTWSSGFPKALKWLFEN